MTTVVLRHADVLVTMDPARREIRDGGMIIRDGVIEAVAPTHALPTVRAANVIDMGGHIVLPGLVNTHHHLYQTLTRVVPAAQDATLFNWLKTLYPIWARLTPEAVYVSALTGLAELLLSGCTTASDHLYLFPNGTQLDDEIRAAKEIGMRFHASRGAMSLGESKGGLPPDSVVENEDEILKDTQRLIQTYHDSRRGAMLRIVVAPCSPFSVTPELMQQSAALARAYGVTLHTHVAETRDEERFCLEKFGHRPVQYMETLRWVGPDVWYAHAVHVNKAEMTLMSRTGCGVAHRLWGRALPLVEHEAGFWHRPGAAVSGCRGERGAGGGRFGFQRRCAHARRSAAGDVAGPAWAFPHPPPSPSPVGHHPARGGGMDVCP